MHRLAEVAVASARRDRVSWLLRRSLRLAVPRRSLGCL
jgi:hypothetical protein